MYEIFVHTRLTCSTTAPPLTCDPASGDTATLNIPVCARANVCPLNGKTGLREANKSVLPCYWRPTSTSFTSLDAIICTDSEVIILQATVAKEHDVKVSGLDTIYASLPAGFHESRKWCLVFISSTEESAQALRDRKTIIHERWEELAVYSGTFVIGQHTLSGSEKSFMAKVIVSCVPFPSLPLIRMIRKG